MKRSILMLLVIAVAILFAGFEKNDDVPNHVDQDAIKAVFAQSSLAVKTGDVDLYISIFTDDAMVMPPGFPIARGKEEIQPVIEGLFGMFELELPYTVEDIEIIGDQAYTRSSWEYSMTPKAGGGTTVSIGKEVDILKKQSDGSWKIYMQCYNYDQ